MTEAALEKALTCFNQALAVDPTYPQTHAGVASVHALRAVVSLAAPHTLMPRAKEAALKTLALDETVADTHAALALVLQYYEWDWVGAGRAYRRALELNPGDSIARVMYGSLLGMLGRAEESITEQRSAVERDPLSPLCRYNLALAFAMARRFDEVIAAAQSGIELDPSCHLLYQPLGYGLVGLGRRDEAVEAFRKQVSISQGAPIAQAFLGWALALDGQRQEALRILGELERRRSESYVGGALLAWVRLGLGDHEQAVSWLHHGADERDGMMLFVNKFFAFDPLRSDPRFQALLKKMNFPASPAG